MKVEIFSDDNALLQIGIPPGTRCRWRRIGDSYKSGEFVVSPVGDEDHILFSRDWPLPKLYSNNTGELESVMEEAKKSVPGMVGLAATWPAFFEVSCTPEVSLNTLSRMRFMFNASQESLRELAKLEVAKSIDGRIEMMYRHGCKKVAIAYLTPPTVLNADHAGKIAMSVYAELAMMGI